jgi:ribonucleoside-triphosphate reductase
LRNLLDQCANFICLISQEVAGAVALNDLITVASSYVWYEESFQGRNYSLDYISHAFQSFLYNINLPFRSGNSPFTNVTLEFGKPAPSLKDEYIIIGGEALAYKYSDVPEEVYNRVALGFLKAMWEGDADSRPWTFPLVTVQITDDFDWENPVFLEFLENLDKHGGAYFENFLSSPFIRRGLQPRDPAQQRSFCCRFQVDLSEVLKVSNTGSVFGSAPGVGSIGVISINFNRLGFVHRGDERGLLDHLGRILESARSVLNKKREFIDRNRELYPTFYYYMKDLSTMFSTISLIGGHEGLINFGFVKRGEGGEIIEEESGLFHDEGLDFAKRVSDFILEKIESFMERDGVPWNFEYAPGETAGPSLARKDLDRYPGIFVRGDLSGSGVFLTSGFQPPYQVGSLSQQLRISSETQRFATGGSIQHIFLNEKPDRYAVRDFVRRVFSSLPIIYITLTPTLTLCGDCSGRITGEHYTCPICGSEDTIVYSRVIGYYRPVARKVLSADRKRHLFEGEENYWQGGRRADWVTRLKVSAGELEMGPWD